MKKIMFALMLTMLVCFCGSVFAQQNGVETVRFSWEHVVPDDMDHYTIYEYFGPGGNPSGVELVIPYEEGTVPPFMSDQEITLPCNVPTERCYRITASDAGGNESGPSNEACKLMTIDCDPDTPMNFTIEVPVVAE